MNDVVETTIFEEGGVKITNLRAILVTNTYLISDIAYVSRQKREPGSAPYWGAGVGLLFLLIGVLDVNRFRILFLLGLVLFIASGYVIRTARTLYTVRIGIAGRDITVLSSRDQAFIAGIVAAMNKALNESMARRGKAADDLR